MWKGFSLEWALGRAIHALTWEKLPLLMPFLSLVSLCRWPFRALCKPCQKFTFIALESHLGLDQNQSFSFFCGTPCSLPLALTERPDCFQNSKLSQKTKDLPQLKGHNKTCLRLQKQLSQMSPLCSKKHKCLLGRCKWPLKGMPLKESTPLAGSDR